MKQEIKVFKKIERTFNDLMYPGYPFSIIGYADLGTEEFWLQGKKINSLRNFCNSFDSLCCYHMVGSELATKGSWLIETHMDMPEDFLKADYDRFYIDNYEVVKLYFAVYSAIRAFRATKQYLFFVYNGEADYVDVKAFSTVEEIEQYRQDYWTE